MSVKRERERKREKERERDHCIQPFHSSVWSLLSTDASLTFVAEATVSTKNRSA